MTLTPPLPFGKQIYPFANMGKKYSGSAQDAFYRLALSYPSPRVNVGNVH